MSRDRRTRLPCVLTILLVASLAISMGCAGIRPDPRYNRDRKSKRYTDPAGRRVPAHRIPEKEDKKADKKGRDTGKTASGDQLDREVKSWEGTPYAWGRSGKGRGVDCSGYTQAVMKRVYGINLPRTSAQQFRTGVAVTRGNLRRGDLVFFNTSGKGVSHVGIYLGGGRFTHSSNSDGVTITKLDDSYYRKRYIGARRVIGYSRK